MVIQRCNLVQKFQISKEMGRKKCYFDGDFWHFSMKNGSLKAYFKTFLSVFDKKCVPLQCRAYAVPSKKDARMGGTLHNIKASTMLCQLAF